MYLFLVFAEKKTNKQTTNTKQNKINENTKLKSWTIESDLNLFINLSAESCDVLLKGEKEGIFLGS